MKYVITTAITAYQSYTIDADDEQVARDKLKAALDGPDDSEGNEILASSHSFGYSDDEEIIDSVQLAELT